MQETMGSLDFGSPETLDASLSASARGLIGSEILRIAGDIREMVANGARVCNLTVGDFDPRQFPIPERLRDAIQAALAAGETNYPPSDGMLELRRAVTEYVAREWGANYPVESVLIASGARPILYSAFRTVVNPGDVVVYPVPSWNNNHYVYLTGAEGVALPTRAEDGFMPTVDMLRPHLETARLICLNSPLNPTGTVISESALRSVVEAVVEENRRRAASGQPHLFLLYDQVYAALCFGAARHHVPTAVVPEAAPWVICLDGISKCFASTGLRVGWVLAAPAVVRRMKSLVGHIGAWAPRPAQVAVAGFLRDADALQDYGQRMGRGISSRLNALADGFRQLKDEGYPVDCIEPQGAIYLSLQLDLVGRTLGNVRIERNEQIRRLLLDEAGLAVVPFQAFGLPDETGWFRLSVGAVSLRDIEESFPRVRALLDKLA